MMKSILIVLVLCTAVFAEDAMFRGNPEHTGAYLSSPLTNLTKVKWQFHTGGQVLSSPVLNGETLYVGSSDHYLYALDRSSGQEKWKFKTQSRITSSPAVAAGLVYFESFDGLFYALDATTGELKWKFQTSGEHRFTAKHLHGFLPAAEAMPDPFDYYLSSPVVWKGSVYFGSGDNYIYSLDAHTGSLRWKFKTGDVVHASPAIADGILYIGSWDSFFYALDATTGTEKWRFETGKDEDVHNQVGIQSSAAVADGMVYFGCRDSKFYALDARTGKARWSFSNKGSWVIASPAVRDGRVYFGTSDSGLFHALDAKTGVPVFSLDFKKWPMFSSPALAGKMIYVGSHLGKLFAIDTSSQKLAWSFDTDSSKQNGPTYTGPDGTPNYRAAFHDSFYDEIILGLEKLMSVGAILSSPVIADGTIYVGSADGNVYALM